MKNFYKLIVGLIIIGNSTIATPVKSISSIPDKCRAVVDAALEKAGMGSFYHPSSCSKKVTDMDASEDYTDEVTMFRSGSTSVDVSHDKSKDTWIVTTCAFIAGFNSAACSSADLDGSCSLTKLTVTVPTVDKKYDSSVTSTLEECIKMLDPKKVQPDSVKLNLCESFKSFVSNPETSTEKSVKKNEFSNK